MVYADYSYYTSEYLLNRQPSVPGEDYLFWEREARRQIDAATFDRIHQISIIPDSVKECTCAITEFLYKAHTLSESNLSNGIAGPLVSWNNDGNSGSIDASQSIYTESGKKAEIRRLIYLYLGNTGLLYAGVDYC